MTDDLDIFLDAWREFGCRAVGQGDPLTLQMDQDEIARWDARAVARYGAWADVIQDPEFGSGEDRRLQLDLVPQPFFGDLESAKVVILLLNPGLAPSDFHAEFEHPDFRDVLMGTLRGQRNDAEFPFLFLDPAWAWTSGYEWWYRRMKWIIAALMDEHGSRRAAQSYVARSIAVLELIPYHSQKAPGDYGLQLPSVKLAKDAVTALHRRGKKIVVARARKHWPLPVSHDRVFWCRPSMGLSFPLRMPEGDALLAGDFIVQALRAGA